jgi:hypothetical protein
LHGECGQTGVFQSLVERRTPVRVEDGQDCVIRDNDNVVVCGNIARCHEATKAAWCSRDADEAAGDDALLPAE